MRWVDRSSFRIWRNKKDIKRKKSRLPENLPAGLIAAYAQTECFRLEKVLEIKARIARGDYQVSGKDVVDKWFPLNGPKASSS